MQHNVKTNKHLLVCVVLDRPRQVPDRTQRQHRRDAHVVQVHDGVPVDGRYDGQGERRLPRRPRQRYVVVNSEVRQLLHEARLLQIDERHPELGRAPGFVEALPVLAEAERVGVLGRAEVALEGQHLLDVVGFLGVVLLWRGVVCEVHRRKLVGFWGLRKRANN